jgi:hypothetical protein
VRRAVPAPRPSLSCRHGPLRSIATPGQHGDASMVPVARSAACRVSAATSRNRHCACANDSTRLLIPSQRPW